MLASPDLQTWCHREHTAFAALLRAWGPAVGEAPAAHAALVARHEAAAERLRASLNAHLWLWVDEARGEGYYVARCGGQVMRHRTYQMALPLLAGLAPSAAHAAAAVRAVLAPDMLSVHGLRSTSAADPRYSNDNIIVPYSNWRGPVWPGPVCAVLCYALARAGARDDALALAAATVRTLAADVRATGCMHENYHAETGAPLAADGFLSWNLLCHSLYDNLLLGVDPFSLEGL